MEFKGTKGKWIAKCLFNNWLIVHEESDNIIEIIENKSNAKLISCAPEMFEMLVKIHRITKDEDIKSQVELLVKKATEL